MRTYIPFTGFAPDAAQSNPALWVDCSGVIPGPIGFEGAPTPASAGLPALAEACTGAALIRKADNTFKLFFGTATTIQDGSSGTSYTDVSRTVGGAYTGNADNPWRFAVFQNDAILATNLSDALQVITSGTDFENCTGSPPNAACIEVVGGFVILANTSNFSDEVYNSAYLDHTSWTVSRATQANKYRLVDIPGSVRGLRKYADKCVAYKDAGMFLGTYVGSPVVWNWSPLPGDVGCSSQEAVVEVFIQGAPAHVFFSAEKSDFYIFDGVRPFSIGSPLSNWFIRNIDPRYRYLVKALHDRKNQRVTFYYPSRGGSAINKGVTYYYGGKYGAGGAWGVPYEAAIEATVEFLSNSITYDNLGTSLGSPTYDALPAIPYDSPFWTQGEISPAIVNSSHVPQTLSGIAGTWFYRMGFLGDDEQFTYIRSIKPRFEKNLTTSQSQTNYYQDIADFRESPTQGDTVSLYDGRFDMHQSARWHQMKHTYVGDGVIAGVMVDSEQEGFN